MAVMMYRYANYKGYTSDEPADISGYKDADKVNTFAKEAMEWAVGNGIISGKDGGTVLDPQGNATRAECATIIMRFIEKFEK
ncbi:MAG: S-layer homology domain-containing protein [Lachnoclostridium sp.]